MIDDTVTTDFDLAAGVAAVTDILVAVIAGFKTRLIFENILPGHRIAAARNLAGVEAAVAVLAITVIAAFKAVSVFAQADAQDPITADR